MWITQSPGDSSRSIPIHPMETALCNGAVQQLFHSLHTRTNSSLLGSRKRVENLLRIIFEVVCIRLFYLNWIVLGFDCVVISCRKAHVSFSDSCPHKNTLMLVGSLRREQNQQCNEHKTISILSSPTPPRKCKPWRFA